MLILLRELYRIPKGFDIGLPKGLCSLLTYSHELPWTMVMKNWQKEPQDSPQ